MYNKNQDLQTEISVLSPKACGVSENLGEWLAAGLQVEEKKDLLTAKIMYHTFPCFTVAED
jgi:hypothetical protein